MTGTLPGFDGVWLDAPFNPVSGYKASFDYVDTTFGDQESRFYQARVSDSSD